MSKISLNNLILHGNIQTKINNDELELITNNSITSIAYNLVGNSYKKHYLEIQEKVHIPFLFSLDLKLDYKGVILLIGDGHILFNCPSNYLIEDPFKTNGKKITGEKPFNGFIPYNKFVNIFVYYGLNEMQILINGKEAFYTKNMPYMRSKEFNKVNNEGLKIGIETTKLSTLQIKNINLTNLDRNHDLKHFELYDYNGELLPTINNISPFERFTSRFSDNIKNEIFKIDEELKSNTCLKIKRSIDKNGEKVTYSSTEYGISYIIKCSNGLSWQSFSWYIVTTGKAETWHRKADYMEDVLEEINKYNPKLAEHIFNSLNDCVGCYGSRCIVKTLYSFKGKKKLSCHGVVMLRICKEDFDSIKQFFIYLNKVIEQKKIEGTLQTENRYLLK